VREREMVAVLGARHAELAREAAAAHGGVFWGVRAERHDDDASERDAPLDLASLGRDPDVRAAFDAIRARETIRLDATSALATEPRAVVRDETIVLEPHLVVPTLDGVRWLAGVDLVRLAMIAPAHAEVPAMFEAYNRGARDAASRAATLPELLGALAVLVGKGVLSLA